LRVPFGFERRVHSCAKDTCDGMIETVNRIIVEVTYKRKRLWSIFSPYIKNKPPLNLTGDIAKVRRA
jgi:hypothetical protein